MRQIKVKDITFGALICAIYAVMLLVGRLSALQFDSLVYYFVPLPIAIYTYLNDEKLGLITLIVSSIVSFLIQISWIDALVLSIPNLIIGYIFGIMIKRMSHKITLLIIFILSLAACFLSFISLKVTMGISFLDYSLKDMSFIQSWFSLEDKSFIKVVFIIIPIVLILDSFMKTIMIYLTFMFVCRSLRIETSFRLKLIEPKLWLLLTSISINILWIISSIIYFKTDLNSLFFDFYISAIITINILLVFYLALGYLQIIIPIILAKTKNKIITCILYFLFIILLPLTYIVALIYYFFIKKSDERGTNNGKTN